MGSLLNFIFDKSSDEQNGPWETCHLEGPIINEIIRENNIVILKILNSKKVIKILLYLNLQV